MQCNAENTCENWMWQLGLRCSATQSHALWLQGKGPCLGIVPTVCIADLNLVILCYGGFVLGSSQFFLLPNCFKKWDLLQSGQKWLENNYLASLVSIREILCRVQTCQLRTTHEQMVSWGNSSLVSVGLIWAEVSTLFHCVHIEGVKSDTLKGGRDLQQSCLYYNLGGTLKKIVRHSKTPRRKESALIFDTS